VPLVYPHGYRSSREPPPFAIETLLSESSSKGYNLPVIRKVMR
jgi:hypothetical protein